MTSKNLAIVFGPALMRRRVENVKQIVHDSPHIVSIVQCMIEEYEHIFKVCTMYNVQCAMCYVLCVSMSRADK
jgi:hypothetical protein